MEQDIKLTIRPMLHLRQEEVSHDPAYHRRTTPHVATLTRKVPAGRVEQSRSQIDHGDLGEIVCGAPDTSAERAKANGRSLGDDGV